LLFWRDGRQGAKPDGTGGGPVSACFFVALRLQGGGKSSQDEPPPLATWFD